MSEQNKDVIANWLNKDVATNNVIDYVNEKAQTEWVTGIEYESLKYKNDKYEKALKEIIFAYENLYVNINGGGDFQNAISNAKKLVGIEEMEE